MLLDFYEDVNVGDSVTVGSYRFTAENIVSFASRFDPQRFHLSEEGAKGSIFGHLCASGWHTASAWMHCNVAWQDRMKAHETPRRGRWPDIGPSPGFEDLRWPRPVYVGDEVTYTATVTGKRPLASRPGWGLVFMDVAGTNQNGDVVLSFKGKIVFEMLERPKA
jgi:acyl dehydratase